MLTFDGSHLDNCPSLTEANSTGTELMHVAGNISVTAEASEQLLWRPNKDHCKYWNGALVTDHIPVLHGAPPTWPC